MLKDIWVRLHETVGLICDGFGGGFIRLTGACPCGENCQCGPECPCKGNN